MRLCSGKGEGEETFRGFVFVGMFCSVLGWVLWVTDGLSIGKGDMAEQYSSFMSSGTKFIF